MKDIKRDIRIIKLINIISRELKVIYTKSQLKFMFFITYFLYVLSFFHIL